MFRIQAAEKNIELILNISEGCRHVLHGDALRLEQVLMNLMSNAIKFTDFGEVEVSVRQVDLNGHETTLEFMIRDTGIGMSQEQIDKLFQSFVQADSSTTRKFGGTGLGLSISKRLVEMMNGRIHVQSASGEGSCFYFTVRMNRLADMNPDPMTTPDELQRLRALVVDGNPQTRRSLVQMLEVFELIAEEVQGVEAAMSLIEKGLREGDTPYRLVLLDARLSNQGAQQLIQTLNTPFYKDLEEDRAPKVILMQPPCRSDEGDERALFSKACGALSKPINCSTLFDVIMESFGHKMAQLSNHGEMSGDVQEVKNRIGGARLLLVEDNAINRQVACEILENAGMIVETAEHGAIGVRMVEQCAYDLVLMDIQMPVMDGYAATRLLRENPRFKDLPIIAMTAHAMTGDREKCLAAGMDDHVTKPIERKKLYGALTRWIQPSVPGAPRPMVVSTVETPSQQGPELPDKLPGIQLSSALDRLGGNRKLLFTLLKEFRRDFGNATRRLRLSLDGKREDDHSSAERLAHSVKGMAGNFAASGLFEAAYAMEVSINKGQREQWPELIAVFETALNEVVESIDGLKDMVEAIERSNDQSARQKRPPLTCPDARPLLEKIHQLCADSDFDATEKFKALTDHFAPVDKEQSQILDQLEHALDHFDFETSVMLIDRLRSRPEEREEAHDAHGGDEAEVVRWSQVEPVLDTLTALVEENDFDAGDKLAELRRLSGVEMLGGERLVEVDEALDRFDFAKALEGLTVLRSILQEGHVEEEA
ncbi:MAG: response regulator [Magnetococcales bacterium]|nr:response regulator [Magnetococcales bacterium]